MMTPKQRVEAAVRFTHPDYTPYLRWDRLNTSDFVADWARPNQSRAAVPEKWVDEWGCGWESIDNTRGAVHFHPIQTVDDYATQVIPDTPLPLDALKANAREYPDRVRTFAFGFFYFERLEKLREFSEFMMDLAADREAVEGLMDRMQAYYIRLVDAAADSGLVDCIAVNEDLGVQDRLTISPKMWREIFMPRYKAVYQRARERGLLVFQHSCGYVQDIVADLATIGVDILELQQLQAMDMQRVAAESRGKMCITAPVDVQAVLPTHDWDRIEAFQRKLFDTFDRPEGGFIPQIYCDLPALGISEELAERLERLITDLRDRPGR